MQIESLVKQSTSVGLEEIELAQFLVTWGGAAPAGGYSLVTEGEEQGQPLDRDETSIQPDAAPQEPVAMVGRPKRRPVTPGLPPRVAKWEQMQSGRPRAARSDKATNQPMRF